MAAKAAGKDIVWCIDEDVPRIPDGTSSPFFRLAQWSPPDDGGDAFRLLAALGCDFMHNKEFSDVFILDERLPGECITERYSDHGGDVEMAMKVAIFRAAIAIGRNLP